MNELWTVKYKFVCDMGGDWQYGRIIVYEDGTEIGTELAGLIEHDKIWTSKGDKLLRKLCGLTDEDIVFYYDCDGVETMNITLDIQKNFDIILGEIEERVKL